VFIESFKEPPEELILDFDKTNAEVHAEAVLKFLVDTLKREWPAVGIIHRRGGNPDVRGRHVNSSLFASWDAEMRGCASSRKEVVEMCRQKARPYLFSNTIAPVVVSGVLKVLDILSKSTDRRDKLENNTKFWRKGLTEAGFVLKDGNTPIVPVMPFNAKLAQDFSRDLFERGVYAIGFFFPVVANGQVRIRTQISAGHETHHL
jgi:hypothetical protein